VEIDCLSRLVLIESATGGYSLFMLADRSSTAEVEARVRLAVGMVVEQVSCPPQDALRLMVACGEATGRNVEQVAAAVLASDLRFP
jgi:hypothetical protein